MRNIVKCKFDNGWHSRGLTVDLFNSRFKIKHVKSDNEYLVIGCSKLLSGLLVVVYIPLDIDSSGIYARFLSGFDGFDGFDKKIKSLMGND